MKKYFAMLNGEQQGPFAFDELLSKGVTKETFIWHQGIANWIKAVEEPELNMLWYMAAPPSVESYGTTPTPPPQPNAQSSAQPNYSQPSYNQPQGAGSNYTYNAAGSNMRGIPPKNYMLEAVLVTIFCCLPFGIAAIVNASNVESRWYRGDEDGAWRASAEASKWTKVSLIIGLVVSIAYLIFIFAIEQ